MLHYAMVNQMDAPDVLIAVDRVNHLDVGPWTEFLGFEGVTFHLTKDIEWLKTMIYHFTKLINSAVCHMESIE